MCRRRHLKQSLREAQQVVGFRSSSQREERISASAFRDLHRTLSPSVVFDSTGTDPTAARLYEKEMEVAGNASASVCALGGDRCATICSGTTRTASDASAMESDTPGRDPIEADRNAEVLIGVPDQGGWEGTPRKRSWMEPAGGPFALPLPSPAVVDGCVSAQGGSEGGEAQLLEAAYRVYLRASLTEGGLLECRAAGYGLALQASSAGSAGYTRSASSRARICWV